EALRIPEFDPAKVIFEITETAAMTGWADGEALVKAIAELGAAVALDDFGTGHSGFSYLKHFPAKWIKIDKEFVWGAANDEHDVELIAAIVGIATSFGARTIAEGVEDQQTLALLKSLGVTHAQGFYVGRPEPIPRA
nr:EAL domain-containing protein [Actinomycetes bacterium]